MGEDHRYKSKNVHDIVREYIEMLKVTIEKSEEISVIAAKTADSDTKEKLTKISSDLDLYVKKYLSEVVDFLKTESENK